MADVLAPIDIENTFRFLRQTLGWTAPRREVLHIDGGQIAGRSLGTASVWSARMAAGRARYSPRLERAIMGGWRYAGAMAA
jgi:hypothetical protein